MSLPWPAEPVVSGEWSVVRKGSPNLLTASDDTAERLRLHSPPHTPPRPSHHPGAPRSDRGFPGNTPGRCAARTGCPSGRVHQARRVPRLRSRRPGVLPKDIGAMCREDQLPSKRANLLSEMAPTAATYLDRMSGRRIRSSPAIAARPPPIKKGAEAPQPGHPPMPCQMIPARRLAGSADNPTAA